MLASLLLATVLQPQGTPTSATYAWAEIPDRTFVGEDFWANRLQDWQVRNGHLCSTVTDPGLRMRTVHLIGAELDLGQPFTIELVFDYEGGTPAQGSRVGVIMGVGAEQLSPTAGALIHGASGPGAGYMVAATDQSHIDAIDLRTESATPSPAGDDRTTVKPRKELTLRISGTRPDHDAVCLDCQLIESAGTSTLLPTFHMEDCGKGLSVVVDPGTEMPSEDSGARGLPRIKSLHVEGQGFTLHEDRRMGPIAGVLYTVSRGELSLSAQMMPIGESQQSPVTLEVLRDETWAQLAEAPIDRSGFVASFRIKEWDATQDTHYRVTWSEQRGSANHQHAFDGIITKDPSSAWATPGERSQEELTDPANQAELCVAALSCCHQNAHFAGLRRNLTERAPIDWPRGLFFPHADLCAAVRAHKPDLLAFLGDQIYEGAGPTFADAKNLELDYLYKWLLWVWSFRDLTRNLPTVVIPDDHDVYQGNLWGAGGRAAKRDNQGGYVHPAEFVRMVERTQTSHLPSPADPAPLEQGIGAYFTQLVWGEVSFAILEDRKWKSGCAGTGLPPSGTGRPDHFNDPEFDTASLDLDGLELLGPRQEAFLADWARDWDGVWAKVVLSQSPFANLATHHGARLEELIADLDSNGWPQTPRNRALELLRSARAFQIAGDQHLASLVQHGIDAFGDGPFSFTTPAIANFYPRKWQPRADRAEHGIHEPTAGLEGTGNYRDGFGNLVTIHAVANPGASQGQAWGALHDSNPGYGIVRIAPRSGQTTFECWPRFADPSSPTAAQYPGWPRTVHILEQDGRVPLRSLGPVLIEDPGGAVIEVLDQSTGQHLYSMRYPMGEALVPVYTEDEVLLSVDGK